MFCLGAAELLGPYGKSVSQSPSDIGSVSDRFRTIHAIFVQFSCEPMSERIELMTFRCFVACVHFPAVVQTVYILHAVSCPHLPLWLSPHRRGSPCGVSVCG